MPKYQENKDNIFQKETPLTHKNTNDKVKTIRTVLAILGINTVVLA
ncbi:MAG: hypothetical protein HQ463_02255 [Bacteroidetes bacterium]|nr:hypothetical protein [Bacteroidota bacterium]